MMIFVITGIDNKCMIQPKTFLDENVAMAELRKLYLEKLAYYNDLAKENNSVVNYTVINDYRASINAGFVRENNFELQIYTCMAR